MNHHFSRRQLRYASAIAFACLIVFTIYGDFRDLGLKIPTPGATIDKLEASPHHAALHLLVPLTSPSLLFCKSLASSILTSYPPPILINFNVTFSMQAIARGAKIQGISSYLQRPAFPYEPSDLVLMADGYDVWFQLPPDVLCSRYIESFPKHSIVFGADKSCWPNHPDSPPCLLAPPSPLPTDAYGPQTEKDIRDRYKFRPRWLNAGNVIGEWSGMESVYNRGAEIAQRKGDVRSDQGILLDVWGEELEKLEYEAEHPNSVKDSHVAGGSGHNNVGRIVMDFESLLFMTMVHSHGDVRWGWNNMTGNPNIGNRLFPPVGNWASEGSDQWLWLAANIITQRTPALLHFNSQKAPLGDEEHAGWWERMWWFHLPGPESSTSAEAQQMAKDKFEAHIVAIRTGAVDASSWALYNGRFGGAWTDSGQWLDWSELCGEWDFIGQGGVWGTA